MKIKKDFVDLVSYVIRVGETTVMPVSIEADDTTCTVAFKTVRDAKPEEIGGAVRKIRRNIKRRIIGETDGEPSVFGKIYGEFTRTGTHEDFFFTTTLVDDVPVKINLRTGQMVKVKEYHPCDWDRSDKTGVNKHITIDSSDEDSQALRISVEFAENNLSEVCRKLADYKTDQYYEWTLGSTAYAVFYEIPSVFSVDAQDIYMYLPHYCFQYINLMGIDADNFVSRYMENLNKEIIL